MGQEHIIVGLLGSAEAILLAYLFARNRCFDRLNAAYFALLPLQQLLQALLWLEIDDSTNGMSCSDANRWLSLVLCLTFSGMGAWMAALCLMQQYTLFDFVEEIKTPGHFPFFFFGARLLNRQELAVWPRKKPLPASNFRIVVMVFQWTVAFTIVTAGITIVRHQWQTPLEPWPGDADFLTRLLWGPACTTRGPAGQQVWNFVVYPHWALNILWGALCFNMTGTFLQVPRPSFVVEFLRQGFWLAVLLYFFLGEEWLAWLMVIGTPSVIVLCLMEPALMRKFRVFDAECMQQGSEGESARQAAGPGFMAAWHLTTAVNPSFTPWAVAPEHDTERQPCCAHHAPPTAVGKVTHTEDGLILAAPQQSML